jgi:hypothetical protein
LDPKQELCLYRLTERFCAFLEQSVHFMDSGEALFFIADCSLATNRVFQLAFDAA